MCGRYVAATPMSDVAAWLDARYVGDDAERYAPRWNVSPTSSVLALRFDRNGERALADYRWGMVGHWQKTLPRYATHNARLETVATRPTFRTAWGTGKRCLVPADGYYEWQIVEGGTKSRPALQPWLMTPAAEPMFAFAGLYSYWRPQGSDDPWLGTCTVITTTPGADISDIHDRQPVVLPRDQWDVWLDRETSIEEARSLLVPATIGTFVRQRVGAAVGNSNTEGPELARPLLEP
jgi:putative SOS response-associated peptidase YedK